MNFKTDIELLRLKIMRWVKKNSILQVLQNIGSFGDEK